MNNIRLGQFGITVAGLGIAAEWWTFMSGKGSLTVMGTGLIGLLGILIVLTAAVRENN